MRVRLIRATARTVPARRSARLLDTAALPPLASTGEASEGTAMAKRAAQVEVTVFDFEGQPLPSAAVTLDPAGSRGKRTSLKLDRTRGVHRASVAPGEYRLGARAKGYEAQERRVTIGEGRVSE